MKIIKREKSSAKSVLGPPQANTIGEKSFGLSGAVDQNDNESIL